MKGEGYAVARLDDLGDGPGFRKVRSAMGVTAFGVNGVVYPPGYPGITHYHDTQDELYFVHRGTAKVEVGGEERMSVAEGNGPVNALDLALRKDLGRYQPFIADLRLVDYKVRILDGDAATAARTRVIIDSRDGARTWSTMGSDTNIIAASAAALGDSLEYAIWKSGAELRRRDERHFTTSRADRTAGDAGPTTVSRR